MSRDYQGPYYSLDDLRSVIDAMCKSIESSGLIDEHEHPSAYSALLDTSKWMAELEGQEPVAWMTANREMTSFVNFHDDDLPLYARQVPAERPVNARLLSALIQCRDRFVFYVGHHLDKGDMGKAAENEKFVALANEAISAAEAQQDRLLQDMHDAGREIDRVMAEATPKAARLTDEEIASLLAASDKNSPRVPSFFMTEPHKFARAIETAAIRKNGLAMED